MTTWHALYEQHCAMRAEPGDLQSSLRKRLIDLADRGHCNKTIKGRFTRNQRGRLFELRIDAADDREPLRALHGLDDAYLRVLALVSFRTGHVHHFTAMIEGVTATRSPWVAAVHLEDDREPPDHDRKGSGACGHAAFHCHVGPTMEHEPKVRVPFPAVGPVGALDWLLSIVIPAWEPVRWARVVSSEAVGPDR
ncbi:MAG TPA: hypothetical protein VF469_24045 [Kofleriaceae bacterium]